MSDTTESLSAILAEMRDERIIRLDGADVTRCLLLNLADRIEAAAKRERAENEAKVGEMIAFVKREMAKSAAHGNAAALREALERIRPLVRAAGATQYVPERKALVDGALGIIDGALAAPARNCDVGTAEEQAERHERFCAAHYKADAVDAQCFGCPASDKKETDCEFVWGQLPFAQAGGGAK